APRGALVFYKDHLALSNGDGTVVVADGQGAPNPSAAIGAPLGWADVPSSGGAPGSEAASAPAASSGGAGAATSTAGGAASGPVTPAPQAPLPEIDLSKLPANVKAMIEKAN